MTMLLCHRETQIDLELMDKLKIVQHQCNVPEPEVCLDTPDTNNNSDVEAENSNAMADNNTNEAEKENTSNKNAQIRGIFS